MQQQQQQQSPLPKSHSLYICSVWPISSYGHNFGTTSDVKTDHESQHSNISSPSVEQTDYTHMRISKHIEGPGVLNNIILEFLWTPLKSASSVPIVTVYCA